MFTTTHLVQALNDRQRRFLKDTGLLVTRRTPFATTVNVSQYAHPADWVMTRRLAWQEVAGEISALTTGDAWEFDQALTSWPAPSSTPLAYHESTLSTLTFELVPRPSTAGTIHELYVALPTTLSGVGVALTVPDDWAWAIKYGALADLLRADGEGSDPVRALYCESRYEMGVELARILLGGPNVRPT